MRDLISASTLLGLNVLLTIGQYKNPQIRKFISPEALKVIEDGKIIEKSLQRELMTRDELIEWLALSECSSSGRPVHRTQCTGYRWHRGVRVAYIESDGDISALTYRETDRHRAAAAEEAEKAEG